MAKVVDLNELNTRDVIEVKIGEESYNVPLGGELPPKRIKALKTDDDIVAFLGEYIPKKKVAELSTKQIMTIMQAWADETKAAQGVTPGES